MCVLCPSVEGAMKPLNSSGHCKSKSAWVHLVCARRLPEVIIQKNDLHQTIDISNIPSWRYGKKCYLCTVKESATHGACLKCEVTTCDRYFHATCAQIWDQVELSQTTKSNELMSGAIRCLGHSPHTLLIHMNLWSTWVLEKETWGCREWIGVESIRDNVHYLPSETSSINELSIDYPPTSIAEGSSDAFDETSPSDPEYLDQLHNVMDQQDLGTPPESTPTSEYNINLLNESVGKLRSRLTKLKRYGLYGHFVRLSGSRTMKEIGKLLDNQSSKVSISSIMSVIDNLISSHESTHFKLPTINTTPIHLMHRDRIHMPNNSTSIVNFTNNISSLSYPRSAESIQSTIKITIPNHPIKILSSLSTTTQANQWLSSPPDSPANGSEYNLQQLFTSERFVNHDCIAEKTNGFVPINSCKTSRQELRWCNDLYTPFWVRGVGKSKEGLCRLCLTETWYKIKISAYWYHLNFHHGISSITGRPFRPPLQEQYNSKTRLREGLCHKCKLWIPLDSARQTPVNVPEIYWWKHAQKCHH